MILTLLPTISVWHQDPRQQPWLLPRLASSAQPELALDAEHRDPPGHLDRQLRPVPPAEITRVSGANPVPHQ